MYSSYDVFSSYVINGSFNFGREVDYSYQRICLGVIANVFKKAEFMNNILKIMITTFLFSPSLKAKNYWEELDRYAFDTIDHRSTHAVLVLHKGQIVFEKYALGWTAKKKHHSWSMAKSVSSLVLLAAVEDGYLNLDSKLSSLNLGQEILNCLTIDPLKKTLSIYDLLTMSSGIKFSERYETGPFYSSVINMLYGSGQSNMGQYALCAPQRSEPGQLFEYSSGDTNILMMALRSSLPPSLKDSYPWKKIFEPMDLNVTWETDAAGTWVGSSWVYMTPKDYLKIGELLLNGGRYQDKQIISSENAKLFFTSAKVNDQEQTLKKYENHKYVSPMLLYGHGSWLNKSLTSQKLKATIPAPYPTITENLAFFLGHRGQSITIIPELSSVILRLGDEDSKSFSREKFLSLAIQSIKEYSDANP
ncbi:MAG: serine hydrolase [Bacteriovoracaceae bacterium]|nr:serine hydrolase [Bacteriovoracaceae bacterium]